MFGFRELRLSERDLMADEVTEVCPNPRAFIEGGSGFMAFTTREGFCGNLSLLEYTLQFKVLSRFDMLSCCLFDSAFCGGVVV